MRTNITVLWFDDETDSSTLHFLQQKTKYIFKRKGYNCNVEIKFGYTEAIRRLNSNDRIDMIFTDYNVDSTSTGPLVNTGISFLLEARKSKIFKQHIIVYSNNNTSNIKLAIKEAIDNENLTDFSNFSFFELNKPTMRDYIPLLEKFIDIYLSRWQELNALRGRMMNEHSDLQEQIKELCNLPNTTDYLNSINALKTLVNNRSKDYIFRKWHNQREVRNAYAHVNEGQDPHGYFIKLKDGTKIYEHQIETKRIDLLNDIETFQRLIDEVKARS